jgi:preprotein translocase subunit SecA
MHFGGEKMISLMEKMGVSENEVIEHPMISAAIKNAQEKISKEIIVEHAAQCQAEWFSKNIMK